MKKKFLLVLITVALIGIIVFSIIIMKSKKAGNTPPTNNNPGTQILAKNKIRVSGSTWGVGMGTNGKEGMYSHDYPTVDYDIESNKEIEFQKGNLGLKFKIIEILKDGIKIKTDRSYSVKKEDGSYSLLESQEEFFIKNNGKIELETPTLDAGASYIIEIAR